MEICALVRPELSTAEIEANEVYYAYVWLAKPSFAGYVMSLSAFSLLFTTFLIAYLLVFATFFPCESQ